LLIENVFDGVRKEMVNSKKFTALSCAKKDRLNPLALLGAGE